MVIVCTSDVGTMNDPRSIYTVAISEGKFVDVMCVEKTHLLYAMQNEDGSTVFDSDRNSVPDFPIDESEVIAFVASAT